MGVTNEYAQLNRASRAWLKRFSHAARFRKALELIDPQPADAILDYGAGDGYFLRLLQQRSPDAAFAGYDPVSYMFDLLRQDTRGLFVTDDFDSIADRSFTKIACLEVLEHLSTEDQREALLNMKRVLAPAGRIVVSVPIEIGPAGLLKNLARYAIRQPHQQATPMTVLRSFLGLKVDVTHLERYRQTHVGFDHRRLIPLFRDVGLRVARRSYSPFALSGPLLNSQLFFVLEGK